MKIWLPVLVLAIILISAGCTDQNKTIPVTTPPPATTLTTPAQTIVSSPISPAYKNVDLALTLNTQPVYGFRMDYPSDWTYKKEHTQGWSAGYNFSSPDEKSSVFVGFDNAAGSGSYYYPLYLITENALDGESWESNIIKGRTLFYYCNDGAGNPSDCSNQRSTARYYMRLMSNDSVTLSGTIKARKIAITTDIKDQSMKWWYTYYIMHAGPMQGYNFTVPGHFELARQVPGDVWDYGMGGIAYGIYLVTPTKTDAESPMYDHMIKSFEVTVT